MNEFWADLRALVLAVAGGMVAVAAVPHMMAIGWYLVLAW